MDYHNNYGERTVQGDSVIDTRIHPGVYRHDKDSSLWALEKVEDFGNPHRLFFSLTLKGGMLLSHQDTVNYYETMNGKRTLAGKRIIAVRLRHLYNMKVNKTVAYSKFKKLYTPL